MIARNAALLLMLLTLACGTEAPDTTDTDPPKTSPSVEAACEPGNGGIVLPDGFCATVFADEIGRARHIAVTADGIVYVSLRSAEEDAGGVVALRDNDGDGRADERAQFGDHYGTGMEVHEGHLYFGTNDSILRYELTAGQLEPEGAYETWIEGFPKQRQHAVKPMTFDDQGNIYVNVGAPSNACMETMREEESPGLNPCPQRERQASVWRFENGRPGQTQSVDGHRYASGIRNSVALAWDPGSKNVFVAQHGRDSLDTLWPKLFEPEFSRDNPAEEFLKLEDGADFMWPFCYWDTSLDKKVRAPEYGGNGTDVGDCDMAPEPLVAFPAHWGPNDLLFYQGDQFPAAYQGGAFIAFHGSWNRAPFPQGGYNVVFVPMSGGEVDGDWEVFADGFNGSDELMSPRDAVYRPTGLAEAPDGSIYVSDSMKGRIWRIFYTGE